MLQLLLFSSNHKGIHLSQHWQYTQSPIILSHPIVNYIAQMSTKTRLQMLSHSTSGD